MSLDLGDILLRYFCLLFSLCVHEAAHAAMANWCGDPSARLMGRLTLDPRKHIDPLGTVILPLLMLTMPGMLLFGWAKPVPFNPLNLNNMRRDPVLIAVAGPASNLVLAFAAGFVLAILALISAEMGETHTLIILGRIAFFMLLINLVLMLFNVIPVPPLDGHYVLYYFLPPSGQRMLEQVGPFGILIAILVARPWLGIAMWPVVGAILWLVTFGNPAGISAFLQSVLQM